MRGKAAFGLTRPSVEEFYVRCMYEINCENGGRRWFTRPKFEFRIVETVALVYKTRI